jgi:tRNA A37 methylthiotransferase MiaB
VKQVTFVELSIYERITPIVSGYLQAYASTDTDLTRDHAFATYSASIRTPLHSIISGVLRHAADVYAFSCYVWNMGLMRRVIAAVRSARPDAHIILGGPQVMHEAAGVLTTHDDKTAVCNGEGEATFSDYLRELSDSAPDLTRVNGLSFYADGTLVTTDPRPRISDLDTIPSPYLTGIFGSTYGTSILETNRGCPYRCGFCFWGAATNDRVYRFDQDRITAEISWMARNGIMFLYIADANFGMLKRDIEISAHIADCARRHQLPTIVYFSAAKNKPHAVTKITGIFQDAGLVTSQPVSMQTLHAPTLEIIQRSNIHLDAFAEVRHDLRERRISSFVELIWPLPGETLDSFIAGIDTLCSHDSDSIMVYPHILLHNTPLARRRDELEILTRAPDGEISEAEIVVQTRDVSEREFREGMRIAYAVHALHNTRSMSVLGLYLTRTGMTSYATLFAAWVDFWRARDESDPIAGFVDQTVEKCELYNTTHYGMFVHMLLHAERALFAEQLRKFAASQAWWADPLARTLLDVDLLNRPYVYSSTPLDDYAALLQTVPVLECAERSVTVEVDERCWEWMASGVRVEGYRAKGPIFHVDHKRMQYPYMANQSLDHNADYCHGMIEKVDAIAPNWTAGVRPDGTWELAGVTPTAGR